MTYQRQEAGASLSPRPSNLKRRDTIKEAYFVSSEVKDQQSVISMRFLLEVLILAICPLPFYEHYIPIDYDYIADDGSVDTLTAYYTLSDFLMAFMFLRVFFLCRTVINFSIYTDAFSKKLCNSYGFISGVRFTVRCHMQQNPGRTIMFIFTVSVLVLAFLLRVFELPFVQANVLNTTTLDNYFNAIWLTVITISTVGYGDLYPHTTMGRCIVIFAAIYGSFLLSVVVLAVNSYFSLNDE